MALRAYSDATGGAWQVWCVVPDAASASTLADAYRDGWLCFERVDGSDRCRLSMSQAPTAWEELPDDRLDMLRRMAEPAMRRSVATTRVTDDMDTGVETSQRDARPSGARRAIGSEDARG